MNPHPDPTPSDPWTAWVQARGHTVDAFGRVPLEYVRYDARGWPLNWRLAYCRDGVEIPIFQGEGAPPWNSKQLDAETLSAVKATDVTGLWCMKPNRKHLARGRALDAWLASLQAKGMVH